MHRRTTLLPFFLTVCLMLAGCDYSRDAESAGTLQTDSRSVELGSAESVHVDVKMGAGNLNISGGAQKLMEAGFRYSRPSWKPEVRYDVSGLRGTLTIRQPEGTSMNTGNAKNQWDLKFNDNARIEVNVLVGAGEGRLEMGSLSPGGLDVEMGAGELRLDLRGAPKRGYDVRIRVYLNQPARVSEKIWRPQGDSNPRYRRERAMS